MHTNTYLGQRLYLYIGIRPQGGFLLFHYISLHFLGQGRLSKIITIISRVLEFTI